MKYLFIMALLILIVVSVTFAGPVPTYCTYMPAIGDPLPAPTTELIGVVIGPNPNNLAPCQCVVIVTTTPVGYQTPVPID